MSELISRQKLIEELETEILENPVWNFEEQCTEYAISPARMFEVIKSQPPADQWIPCNYAVPATTEEEEFYRDILIKRKTGEVVEGWYNDMENTWLEKTVCHMDVSDGVIIYDAVEWKYPEPYKGVE